MAVMLVLVGIGLVVARKTILKPPVEYETAPASYAEIKQTLAVSGEIAAEKQAVLKFQTGGRLAWIGVKEGDTVKQWQAVAALDKSILERNVRKALSDYMHQRWDFEQIRENNLVTSDNYDQYTLTNIVRRLIEQEQFLLDKTVTEVEIQDITKKLATLVTPVAGIVTRIDTPVAGVNVTAVDTIEVVDPATLYFEVEIDEAEIGKVTIGQAAEITLEAFADEVISSEVTAIEFKASTSDSGGTVFKAKLRLNAERGKALRLGMTGDAVITLAVKPKALTVPTSALVEKDGQTLVRVKRGKQISDREVSVGLETDEVVEISSGLKEGDGVITGEVKK